MNALVDLFLERSGDVWQRTLEHLWLTGLSVALAVVIGVALGIMLTRRERLAGPVIGFANVVQTIPSIALLGFVIPLIGIGAAPAILALFLYALLPIIRNTFTGIQEIDESIRESGRALGMTGSQLLRQVELPLALPVIFAGIRTATVINVGVATLCALIAAGGLGEFIFTGIALNNSNLILIGAIPAALLAILLDMILGAVQDRIRQLGLPLAGLAVVAGIVVSISTLGDGSADDITIGLPAEFMERKDGWEGLKETYSLDLNAVQMNAGLMYSALKEGKVDAIAGYSTDGRIAAFDLVVLEDDRNYFPPYFVAPLVRNDLLQKHPGLDSVLNLLAGRVSGDQIQQLNYQVDHEKRSPHDVAVEYLKSEGFETTTDRIGDPDIVIGGKNFTEQFVLAEMFESLIENNTSLTVGLKQGLGGTRIAFEALRAGEIDIYPEYTGTGLLVLLEPDSATLDSVLADPGAVYDYVRERFAETYGLSWLKPLGFNNTYVIMMRREDAAARDIASISELAASTTR